MLSHVQFSDRNGSRRNGLHDDVETLRRAFPVDLSDAQFDMAQPRLLLVQGTFELGALQHQHAAQVGRRDLVFQQRADLLQRQAELLQREDAVEPGQLPDRVVAVPGLLIDMGRPQQAELVVEPQLPAGDLGDLREFADTEHVRPPGTLAGPSPRDRVR